MKKKDITIKDLIDILLPKLWIVAIVSVLVSGLAFAYSHFFKADTYTSSSLLYVHGNSASNNEVATGDNIVVARYMLENYKVGIQSEVFLEKVVRKLSNSEEYTAYRDITDGINANKIRSMMSFSHYDETEVFSISITSTNPALSCVILKAVHNTAITEIQGVVPSAFELTALQNPVEPELHRNIPKNSKHEIRNAVLSFFVAAVVSVVAIWVYSFFDVIIRDRKKLADNIDVPILGVIPRHELPTVVKGDAGNV